MKPPHLQQQAQRVRLGMRATMVFVIGFFIVFSLIGWSIFPTPLWLLVAVLAPAGIYKLATLELDQWQARLEAGRQHPMLTAEEILQRMQDSGGGQR